MSEEEYNIVYCESCNAVTLTQEEINCLHCDKPVQEIGFQHEVIQSIINNERSEPDHG